MTATATTANFSKFFRNGKTFSAFCRARYGQSRKVWEDTALWRKQGQYAIAFDVDAADAKFGNHYGEFTRSLKPAHREEAFDEENYAERQMEDMADYIHSGAGLDNYYADRDAGYAY